MLEEPGEALRQYDAKILAAALKSTTGPLHRRIRRIQQEMYKQGKYMSGRQSLRLVLEEFQTDKTSKELFDVTHLEVLR